VQEEKILFHALFHRGLDCAIVGQGNQEDHGLYMTQNAFPPLFPCFEYLLILDLIILFVLQWVNIQFGSIFNLVL